MSRYCDERILTKVQVDWYKILLKQLKRDKRKVPNSTSFENPSNIIIRKQSKVIELSRLYHIEGSSIICLKVGT